MAKKKMFDDPLEGIDPVLKDAFVGDETNSVRRHSASAYSELDASGMDQAPPQVHSGPVVTEVEFPVLSPNPSGQKLEEDVFSRIPVTVSVELGRCQVSLKDVFELSDGAIVELDRLVGEPLDLVVNGQVIAQGEVVAVDNNYGLRITAIKATPKP